jgi:hypothetical protein
MSSAGISRKPGPGSGPGEAFSIVSEISCAIGNNEAIDNSEGAGISADCSINDLEKTGLLDDTLKKWQEIWNDFRAGREEWPVELCEGARLWS